MYLRRHRKKVAGEEYGYWSLVESIRTVRGPRQRIVATIGKLPDYDREEQIGWEEIGRILDGKSSPEPGLFDKSEEPPLWAKVNLNSVSVERLRHFGDIYLALLLWSKLGFAAFCKERLLAGREEIPWAVMVCILVIARFCSPSSELLFYRTRMSFAGICKHAMANCSAQRSTFSFMTLLQPILRETPRATHRPKEAIVAISVLIVPKSVLV
jgi:hypothetical protein